MNRVRLGVEGQQGEKEINLKALFAAFDLPWDDARSPQIFQRTLAELERRESITPVPKVAESTAESTQPVAVDASATNPPRPSGTAMVRIEDHDEP